MYNNCPTLKTLIIQTYIKGHSRVNKDQIALPNQLSLSGELHNKLLIQVVKVEVQNSNRNLSCL